ncbi:pyocin activator PrtN family protein [Vibrio sp. 10N.261.46.E11]|uniref:pyocin activator PrtN family protein n=1 Tax=Vibrio sp. 10N.261.46.E11 TaxID=3229662 RepID=UPI00354D012F
MNTEFGLLTAFGDSIVPVSDICEPLLNCKKQTAYQQIKAYTFPVPAFRLADSNKNDYFVTVEDLASYIEAKVTESQDELAPWIAYFCVVLPNLAYFCGGYCEAEEA